MVSGSNTLDLGTNWRELRICICNKFSWWSICKICYLKGTKYKKNPRLSHIYSSRNTQWRKKQIRSILILRPKYYFLTTNFVIEYLITMRLPSPSFHMNLLILREKNEFVHALLTWESWSYTTNSFCSLGKLKSWNGMPHAWRPNLSFSSAFSSGLATLVVFFLGSERERVS